VAPTIGSADRDYSLWRDEKFIPLVLVGEIDSLDEGIGLANASAYGLTAGFYGAPGEIDGFLDRIEAGVTYVNRPQGATTGAWPGYQPFRGLERQRQHRQGDRVVLVPAAVPARAVAHDRRLSGLTSPPGAQGAQVPGYRGFLIRLAISPTTPRRKAITQTTKMRPWVTVTQAPSCAR
jgi:hypothetical protein